MTSTRRILPALALVIALTVAAAALALSGAPVPPRKAIVTSQGLKTSTALGSYCANDEAEDGPGAAGCGDAEYPLHPRTFVPVEPGSTVRVNVRRRAKAVEGRLVQGRDAPWGFVGPNIKGTPVAHTHGRIWRLHMPDDLRSADALSFFVKFRGDDDADFWVGVKPVEQWP
ncbi:MAG TPA: hypothetical protein VJT75_13960 [Thermoleophilaceae bacterium]|nr:hypothetical protein [Thermoleophilaceae bacterium]